ncbi:S-adenosyl-L-methionine-dependent methyltransferase [Melanomma pulvis-pyrius CBS 109.77]|uniref:S-adenosyl-L-methionine-dependent methyltransferase n=1 Tax=Melanomma pulvis-pyrius CBS 109.77 TaxID=1314802 RepID=A0A6A6XU05_9PLEO|nr:S-adenosyl-L-methionine-dependent methyltransferase [Melanomma pulvis-pyrius CBS 109.77]
MSEQNDTMVHDFVKRLYVLSNPDDCKAVYDEWATTYNADVQHAGVDYVAPILTASAVIAAGGNISGSILDAGCGTGFVGVALAKSGANNIDGIDLSPSMLEFARKTGVYKDLTVVDMTKAINKQDQSYDVITCVGTFTQGHVGPEPALQELVRLMKKDGLLVCTVLNDVWVSGGYKAEIERLEAVGAVTVLKTEDMDYYRRGDDQQKARMVILKRV